MRRFVLFSLLALCFGVANVSAGGFRCNVPEFAQIAERLASEQSLFWFAEPPPQRGSAAPIPVIWRGGGEKYGATQFDLKSGRLEVLSIELGGPQDAVIADVLPHEIGHVVLMTRAGRVNPVWLQEGAAIVFESPSARRWWMERARAMRDHRGCAFFRVANTEYSTDGEDVLATYATGYALVEHLIARKGPRAFASFYADNGSVEQRLQRHYKTSLQDLWHAWNAWLDAGKPGVLDQVDWPATVERGGRPKLLIFTAPQCVPCIALKEDWTRDPKFRAAVTAIYDVEWVDTRGSPQLAKQYGVTRVPAFAIAGQHKVLFDGYGGKAVFLAKLSALPVAVPLPAPPPETIEEPGEQVENPIHQDLSLPTVPDRSGVYVIHIDVGRLKALEPYLILILAAGGGFAAGRKLRK